jgi:PAS domain S-box-containing protein
VEPAILADSDHGVTFPDTPDASASAAFPPGPAAAASRRFVPKRLAAGFAAVIIGLLLASSAVSLWQLRLIELAEAQREIVSFNRTLALHTSRSIESVDLVVLAAVRGLQASTSPAAVDTAIATAGAAHGVLQLQSVEFYAPDGTLVRSSGNAIASIAGSARLAFHRQHAGTGPFIDEPTRDAQGHWLLFVSRRVSTPSGDFAGVVSASVTTTYFLDFYRTLEPRYDSVVTLATRSGTVVVRHPGQEVMAGRSIAAMPVFTELLAARNDGAIAHRRLTDDVPVITAATVLKEYPLVQLLSLTEESALSGWRREAAVAGTIGAATLLVLILLFASLSRQLGRREALLADLRSSEARLLEAQRIGHVGDWAVDVRTGTRTWSPETFAMYGIDPASGTPDDTRLAAIIHADDRQRVDALWRDALRHGTPYRIDYRILHRGVDVRWVSVRGEALRDRNGRLDRLRGTVTDITEQKLAQVMSQRVAAIVESTSDAICSQATDGTYQSWNRGAERMLGLSASQALGRQPAELFAETQGEEVVRLVALAARGHAVEGYPGTLRAADGSDVHVSMTLSPIRDEQDAIVAVSTIMRDVTEARRSEMRARMQHEVTRALSEATGVADAITRVIETLCLTKAWNCGVLYHRDPDREPLRIANLWHDESPAGARLADAIRNRATPPAGIDLVERVWQDGTSTWYPDLANDPSFVRQGAPADGVRSMLLFPVLSGATPVGVVGLMSHEAEPADPRLLDAMRSIGSQLGQFIERRRTQEALRESEERFRSLVELSADWFWEQDARFRFTIVSNGALKAGVRIASHIGRCIWEIPDIAPIVHHSRAGRVTPSVRHCFATSSARW